MTSRDLWAESVWTRDPRAGRAGNGLSREQIVTAAIQLLDAEGPAGLSMRKLAQHLGAGTTSAYWHVANKGELLDLAFDEVLGEVPVPDEPVGPWRDTVTALVRGTRDVFRRHPWVVSVIGQRPMIGPNSIRLSDRTLGVMTAAGFSIHHSAFIGSALTSYALGHAVAETANRAAAATSGLSDTEMVTAMSQLFEQQADQYPHIAAWMHENQQLDYEWMRDDIFEFGLRCQLDGFALLLERD